MTTFKVIKALAIFLFYVNYRQNVAIPLVAWSLNMENGKYVADYLEDDLKYHVDDRDDPWTQNLIAWTEYRKNVKDLVT